LAADGPEFDRERRDFDRDRLILGFGDTFGIGDAAEAGGPLEICRAQETGEAGGGEGALETGDTLGIGSVLEVRGEADSDLGDGGFDDPIGGGEQKFDSFDSFDSVDSKLELICAYESSCSCDDSMPLTSGGSSASVRSGTSGAEEAEEVEEWKKSLVSTDLTLQSMRGLTRSNQGIPRIREWSPIGATRKVSC
jgi:hypothetical protein